MVKLLLSMSTLINLTTSRSLDSYTSWWMVFDHYLSPWGINDDYMIVHYVFILYQWGYSSEFFFRPPWFHSVSLSFLSFLCRLRNPLIKYNAVYCCTHIFMWVWMNRQTFCLVPELAWCFLRATCEPLKCNRRCLSSGHYFILRVKTTMLSPHQVSTT